MILGFAVMKRTIYGGGGRVSMMVQVPSVNNYA